MASEGVAIEEGGPGEPPGAAVPYRRALAYLPPRGEAPRFTTPRVTQQWERLRRFLAECTDADPDAPRDARLVLRAEVGRVLHPALRVPLKRAHLELGVPTRAREGEAMAHEWRAGGSVHAARAVLRAGEPWPTALRRAATLRVEYDFRWRDPETGALLEGQDLLALPGHASSRSSCVVVLGSRGTFEPAFYFPFIRVDEPAAAFLRAVWTRLPVPLDPRRFRLSVPNGSGKGSVLRPFDTAKLERLLAG